MKNTNTTQLIDQLNDFITLLSKLNNLTYHNLQKTKKIISELNEKNISSFETIKKVKLQLFSLDLLLEEINELIQEYKEDENE